MKKITLTELSTKNVKTWCPGCPNFIILESVKRAIFNLINHDGYKQTDFAMVTGIGCHAKIYDYLNLSSFCGLHGRVLPTSLGVKLGNPKLTVLGFGGDGDTYSEGMSHFIHAGRYNLDMTMIVFNNQRFSLTTGQSTPTTPQGYVNKTEPLGEFNFPINPLKIALAANFSFIARCDAYDLEHTAKIIQKAVKHKGFSYVEILQDCLIFNKDATKKRKLTYKISDNHDRKKAEQLAEEWNYNNLNDKIPLGIIYQEEKEKIVLSQKWPQLMKLVPYKK